MYVNANLCIAGQAVRPHISDNYFGMCHMKEEQDVSGTAPPEEESKTKKYIRIAFASVLLAILVLVFVMAFLRRYGT